MESDLAALVALERDAGDLLGMYAPGTVAATLDAALELLQKSNLLFNIPASTRLRATLLTLAQEVESFLSKNDVSSSSMARPQLWRLQRQLDPRLAFQRPRLTFSPDAHSGPVSKSFFSPFEDSVCGGGGFFFLYF